jgi:hypothetical protein
MASRFASPAHRARVVRAAILSALLGVSTACYTSHPLMGAPDPGTLAVVTLNDRGRSVLNEALGANAERVEGSVLSRTDSSFVLAVRSVEYFGGTTNTWKGEEVRVPIAGVRGVTERRFARGRTYVIIGASVAALVAFLLTRNILADDGRLAEEPGEGPPPVGSFVPTRP